MHYFLYPIKDAFITNSPSYLLKNTGLDEILEVEKIVDVRAPGSISGSLGTVLSRALLQFDLTELSKSYDSTSRYYLNLKVAESIEVPVKYTIAAYPLAVSWSMGTGYLYDGTTVPDGVSWRYTKDSMSDRWWDYSDNQYEGGGVWFVSQSLYGSGSGYAEPPFVSPQPYDPFPFCTASISGSVPSTSSLLPVTGGFACYQSFEYQTSDVHMDVTPIVVAWLTNTIPNNGLIVLHSGESDPVNYGKLRFFSKETNTIYAPCLDVSTDDSVYVTGSSDPISINTSVLSIRNITMNYKYGSVVRMDVNARARYQVRTFTNNYSSTSSLYYLPYNSFYSVKDAETSNTVIPYDDATRLSYDVVNGNYFFLNTTGLAQERFYTISIKCEQNGSIVIFDVPTVFKITR